MKGKFVFILSFITAFTGVIFAQKPTPTPTPRYDKVIVTDNSYKESFYLPAKDLPTILQKADEQTGNYQEQFKNLLGEERKTFETFDKNGNSKKQTTVESNFIVYQSAKNEAAVTEYRNVVKVNGKTVGGSEKRATDLFTQLAKSSSPQQELEDIQKESSRYDKNLEISGLTLFQAPILAEYIRPFFDFQLAGQEKIDGNDVYVVRYQQKSKSPYILINNEKGNTDKLYITFDIDLPGAITEPNALLNGKLWIDANTFQVWREQRELTIQPSGLDAPLRVVENEFEYQKSDLGILTPKKITFSYFKVKAKDKGRDISAYLETKATFEYDKFTKSDVEVKSGEVKN
ncbi:MAG: hypothetical protein M3033_13285 [Acidobacteriota bacterium]|nr:hypothetical protein [Acidobacteriota bacterium]